MKKALLFTIFTLLAFWGYGQATLPIDTDLLSKDDLPMGFSHHGLASDYSGPKLKFNSAGDYLVINYTGTANVLTFMLGVNNSFSGDIPNKNHKFIVQESSDGVSYQDLATYEAGDSKGLQTINGIGENSKYIKFIFDTKASGYNFGLYNIDISEKTPLPIILSSFNATLKNDKVNVAWATVTEENNDYFVVEWSADGVDFIELSKVYSSERAEYSYTHTNPVKGYNYYRLAQYDKDGRSEKFDVVSVLFDKKEEKMSINPNAVYSNLKIEFSTPVVNGRLHIYDTQGKLMKSSILASGIDVFNLDVSTLPTGQYVVKYLDNNKMVSERFLKK